jgi:hypothetical protein
MFAPRAIPLLDGARPRRIAELLTVVWGLGLLDLALTLWAHHFTPFHELNPLARTLLDANALGSLILFKFSMTFAGTCIFWTHRHRRSTELAAWLCAVAYVILCFQWSTYTQAALATGATPIG